MIGPSTAFLAERLLRPRSLAILGAASATGQTLRRNLAAAGFPGALHLLDHPAELDDLPAAPDLGVIAGEDLGAGLDAFAALGTRAVVAIGQQQQRSDPLSAALYRASSSPPAVGGVRVLGPGSFGLIVPGAGLDLSLGHVPAKPGKLALISPSTALCRTVLDWAEPNGVGFSHLVGTGLETDLDAAAMLDIVAREPGVGAILLDVRGIRDRRAFMSAARAAARLRPVIALHAGAQQLDPSGRSDEVFAAAVRRAGILRVSTLAELLAAAEVFTRARAPRSERLMIVTNAISGGQLAADEAVRRSIPLATLEGAADIVLRTHLPPQPPVPGLIWTGDHPTRPAEVAAMLSAIPDIGGIVTVMAPTGERDAAGIAALAASQAGLKLPLIASVLGETTGATHRRTLVDARVPVFASPEQAVRAFAQLVMLRRAREAARELPSSRILRLAPHRDEVARLFAAVRRDGRTALFQDEALDVLSAYGMPVVPYRHAGGPAEAADAAGLLGFPVTVKRRRLDPNASGVLLLDLPDQDAVRQAATRLDGDTGLIVQRQAGRAQRLRVAVADDMLFGPAIGFGPGGRDSARHAAYDLPPLNLALAFDLIGRSAAAPQLAAGQGHGAANLDAVADTLARVSQFVVDFPEVDAIIIDPLFADEHGVSAAEAWIGLRPPGHAARTAIAPYPAELAERWAARTGEALDIRPIRPEDAEAHAAMMRRLSPEDIRYRFFSQVRELPPEQIARMTQIDYDREMAFIAVHGDLTVGVARLVEQSGGEAEFAVVVDPAMKGSGLGRRLMERIIDWGRHKGLTLITGQILSDNARMLTFIRRLGFQTRRDPHDPDIVEARLTL